MKKQLLGSGKLFALNCIFMSVAFAADDGSNAAGLVDSSDMALQLDEVVVSGSRTATKLSETPMAIGVVSDSALKRDKPKTMGDAINRIAGVNWIDLGLHRVL